VTTQPVDPNLNPAESLQPNPFLTLPGFTQAQEPMAQRLVINIQGLEKTGKTHLALTSPSPLAFISIDKGEEGVIQKFQYNESIARMEVRYDPTAGSSAANDLWEYVKDQIRQAYQINQGTLIIDTATELWEMMRLGRLGKLTQVRPHHYAPVNAEMNEVIRWAYDATSMNTIFLHKMGSVFDVPGQLERKGFSQMGYLVQANIQAFRRDLPEGGSSFGFQVLDHRTAPQLNGYVLEGERATIPWLLHYSWGGS